MISRRSLSACSLLLAFAPMLLAQTKQRPKAGEAIPRIQSLLTANDAAALERVLPQELVAKRADFAGNRLDAWRASFAQELAAAKVVGVREKGDEAVVRFTVERSTDERELPLRYVADDWVIAAAQSYVVKGKSLDDRRGKEVARVTLQARTSNDGYGKSGFSFTHVTSVPDECKNRMDVWHCHNGDVHMVRDDRIANLGKQKLAKLDALPIGVEWSKCLAPMRGNAYVVHCQDGDRRDFYVKLLVVDVVPDAVTIEWTLLSDGRNAPASISTPQPLVSKDGADGADGLCAKGDSR